MWDHRGPCPPHKCRSIHHEQHNRSCWRHISVPSLPKYWNQVTKLHTSKDIHLNSFSTCISEFSESSKMRSSDPHPLLVFTWPSLACGQTYEFAEHIWSHQTLICFPLGHWKKQSSSIVLSTNSSNLYKYLFNPLFTKMRDIDLDRFDSIIYNREKGVQVSFGTPQSSFQLFQHTLAVKWKQEEHQQRC